MGVKEETITYVCDGCGIEEIVRGSGSENGFRPHLGMPVGWESIPTKNHEYLIVCYDCFQKQDNVSTLKVISFIDDCGHNVVIDVTNPRNRVQVYRDILSEGYAHTYKDEVKKLIAEADAVLGEDNVSNVRLLTVASNLIDALDYVDLENSGGRDGLVPFTPTTSWK
jgi:hypothetical protein